MAVTPKYRNKTFIEVYPTKDSFVADTQSRDYFPITITEDSAKTLYYLLCSKYRNNPISNEEEELFRIKLQSIVYQYGGAWEKKLDVQKKILALTDEDLAKGSTMIYNHAYNPESDPTAEAAEPLGFINDQNVTANKKSKIESYGVLWGAIRTDVSKQFIDKFKVCFRSFVGYDYMEVSEDDE